MPSSITSAPAAGRAFRIASEVSPSGSPAVTNVTSAARPCAPNSAKRWLMRVVMRDWLPFPRPGIKPPLPAGGETDVDSANHEEYDAGDDVEPFFRGNGRARGHQPHPPEIDEVGGGHRDQEPAHDFLAVEDHNVLPRCSATVKMSLSPRPHMFITMR